MKTFLETLGTVQESQAHALLWEIYMELVKDDRIPYDVVQNIKRRIEELKN